MPPPENFDILDALRRVLEHFQVWIHLLDNRIDSVTYTVDATPGILIYKCNGNPCYLFYGYTTVNNYEILLSEK